MSDSDEAFASADEGELDALPAAAGSSKGRTNKTQSSSPAMEPEVQDQKPEAKPADTSKAAAKDTTPTESSKQKQNKKKGKGPEKGGGGKEMTKSDEVKSEDSTSEKAKQKPQSGKGKKGKQKGGKGKSVQGEEATSSCSKEEDKKVVDEKSPDVISGETEDKEVDKEIAKDSDSNINQELKSENFKLEPKECEKVSEKSQDIEDETDKKDNSKELKSEESVEDTTGNLPSGEAVDLTNTPAKDKDTEISLESQENLTMEQKAAMIKSPSSQSISRPEPDHTDKQEAVLDKLAGVAQEKKSGWGWGWGSSLLEVASSSVSTFSNQVGEGFNTMIETVESTLNVPNPEELAQKNAQRKDSEQQIDDENKESKAESTTGTQEAEADNSQGKASPESENQSAGTAEAEKQSAETEETEKQSAETEETDKQSSQDGGTTDNKSGGGWFSNITKMVESTSKNLVTGSLDVLETLGKKTFDVINDHDPGLKKARGFLHDRGDKPNLSAMLRDAKEQQEARAQQEKESEEARKAHFGSLFDDFQGLAHLEALEMLSNQSEKRVNVLLNALPAEAISAIKPQLLEIKQNFEIDEEEEDVSEQEFGLLVSELLKKLNVGTTPDKLIRTRESIDEKLTECCDTDSKPDVKEIHQVAISSLAELTSKCIEQFHKAGELILIQNSTVLHFADCSSILLRLTKVLTAEVGILSTKFSECLNKREVGDEIKVNHLVTNIYLEASNSSSYIQDGFQLLLPVLQQAAIEKSQEPES